MRKILFAVVTVILMMIAYVGGVGCNDDCCEDPTACDDTEICVNCDCKDTCSGDSDCDDNNACTTDQCVENTYCDHVSKDCYGLQCDSATGQCIPECVNWDDCDACHACQSGKCVPSCQAGETCCEKSDGTGFCCDGQCCPAGEPYLCCSGGALCNEGWCVNCINDGDCPEDTACTDNYCESGTCKSKPSTTATSCDECEKCDDDAGQCALKEGADCSESSQCPAQTEPIDQCLSVAGACIECECGHWILDGKSCTTASGQIGTCSTYGDCVINT